METSGLPEPLRARVEQVDAQPALETVRRFLGGHVADAAGLDEVRSDLRRLARSNTRSIRRNLAALETLLAESHPPGTLLRLVAGDGNWALDHDPTDAGAADFLRGLARMLREVIDEVE